MERPGAERPSQSTSDSTSTHFQAVPLGTFGNCRAGIARAPGYREHADLDAVEEVQPQRAAVRRSPCRGLQHLQHRQLLGPRRARHLGAEHVRRDYQHDQLAPRGGAGVQAVLLGPERGERPTASPRVEGSEAPDARRVEGSRTGHNRERGGRVPPFASLVVCTFLAH